MKRVAADIQLTVRMIRSVDEYERWLCVLLTRLLRMPINTIQSGEGLRISRMELSIDTIK